MISFFTIWEFKVFEGGLQNSGVKIHRAGIASVYHVCSWCGFSRREYKSVERRAWTLEKNGLKISVANTERLEFKFKNEIKTNGSDHSVRLRGRETEWGNCGGLDECGCMKWREPIGVLYDEKVLLKRQTRSFIKLLWG